MTRRTTRAATLLSLAALLLSGCAADDPNQYRRTRNGTEHVYAATPPTFVKDAQWTTQYAKDAPVELTSEGILTLDASAPKGKTALVMIDATTGKEVWSTRPATLEGDVDFEWVRQEGRGWVVLTGEGADGKSARVLTYDPLRGGHQATATQTQNFTGAKKPPTVDLTDTGVLVKGAKGDPALLVHPQSGQTTSYGKGPKRNGKAAVPRHAVGQGFLTQYPQGGVAYATTDGGWESSDVAPKTVETDQAHIAATDGTWVVLSWPTTKKGDEEYVLSLHDATTGAYKGAVTAPSAEVNAYRDQGLDPTVSTDGTTVAWGGAIFDTTTGKAQRVDLEGGRITAVHNGIAYVRGAAAPLDLPVEGQQKGAQRTTRAITKKGQGKREFAAVDLKDRVLLKGSMESSPVGFNQWHQGVFAEGETLYAVNQR